MYSHTLTQAEKNFSCLNSFNPPEGGSECWVSWSHSEAQLPLSSKTTSVYVHLFQRHSVKVSYHFVISGNICAAHLNCCIRAQRAFTGVRTNRTPRDLLYRIVYM
ncbi:hypothetical protein ILYODFUR_005552 [Ilyodon furcidens]|uniref:Uncharacterized protein n=1 Tax=Ilyodon furcidens TaxID=33524 RepID=A0ABV0TJ52_9TELE